MGKSVIVGIDEAGRGPLAGPVVAAAVILPEGVIIGGLNDSKKLSEKKRDELAPIIKEKAIWGIGFVDNKTIDSINILNATFLAMERATDVLLQKTDIKNLHFMVDGNRIPTFLKEMDDPLFSQNRITVEAIVKGDSKIPEIMAASILAKTERDKFMKLLSRRYPLYGFEKHKGYGTKAHYEAIDSLGISPIHRKSFLKKYIKNG